MENFKSGFRRQLISINNPPRKKKKGINNRKETMPIDRHIHSSKAIVNPHPLLMTHGLCIEDRHGIRYSLGGKHGNQIIIPIRYGLHMVM